MDPSAAIERYFAARDNDGDFVSSDPETPYKFWPSPTGGRLVYSTKPAAARRILSESFAKPPGTVPILRSPRTAVSSVEPSKTGDCPLLPGGGLIGRYGLPCATDVDSVRKLTGRRKILFLGDLDPSDLLIFAWLRARLGPRRIEYLGIGDRLLNERAIVIPDSYWIKLSRSERRSLPVLNEAFPDFRDVAGPHCAAELDNGRKLELEAIVSADSTR
jgi:hypothetical protein